MSRRSLNPPNGGVLRTFCVIPFQVRDHSLFQAVHEDRIIINHQGRFQDFHFSGVLSPSHNLAVNILGPLLESVQMRRNASLLVCLPNSGESSEAVMQLYSNFLPLLFRAAPQCSIAHVAVVEIKKDGRQMTDMLRTCKVSTLQDLETEEVLRANSTSHWGAVMEKLSQRCISPSIADSSLFVRIELENCCEVILGDLGYSQEALHLATLVLRSDGVGGLKTNAPHVPFTYLLANSVPPRGVTHLVCFPDPACSVTQSMRLIHFVSSFERGASVLDLREDTTTASDSSHDVAPTTPLRKKNRDAAAAEPGSKRFSPTGEDVSGAQWRSELLVDHSPIRHPQNQPSQQRGAPPRSPPNTTAQQQTPTRSHSHNSGNSNAMNPQRRIEKQRISDRLVYADNTSEELKRKIRDLQDEIISSRKSLDDSSRALKEAKDQIQDQQHTINSSKTDTAGMSDLINKLLARVADLESHHAHENLTTGELKAKNRELALKATTLQSQLQDSVSELRSLKKKEANRVRSNMLHNIEAASSPRPGAGKHQSHAHSDPNSSSSIVSESSAAMIVAVKQLRAKSEKLEMENRELRLKAEQDEAYRRAVAAHTSAVPPARYNDASGDDHNHLAIAPSNNTNLERECATLKQQLTLFSNEVTRVQQEKDELQKMVLTHPRSVELADSIQAVVAAVSNSCDSLLAQLRHLEISGGAATRMVDQDGVEQHITAVTGLKAAVQDIASRRSAGSSSIPSTAGAGDCELMSHFLTFEIERLSHLRAFLPSLSKLCYAVDRFKMRTPKRL